MYLLPVPKELKENEGRFFIHRHCEIVLNADCNLEDFQSAALLKKEIRKALGLTLNINKAFIDKPKDCILLRRGSGEEEGYEIHITEEGIEISSADEAGLFYGVQTLRQIIRQSGAEIPALSIKDSPFFKNRGFYHDVTRGKVPTLATLKELADRLSFYKINQLQLYIEHTFAFKNLSEVWVDKGPLTAEEIMELDKYCLERHIELVPSLSTFGHFYEILNSKTYCHLSELEVDRMAPYSWIERMRHHTLDVSNDDSLKLVQEMLEEFIPLFTSNKFNICCDETFDLGKGKNKEMAEKFGEGRLYTDFLNKVIEAVKKYGKEVMFWGDIILRHPENLSDIPKDVICLNWAYHASVTEEGTRIIAESGFPQYVCPGVSGWNMLMNDMDNAFTNIKKMIEFGKKHKAIGVLNTDWGDYGHINFFGNSMPGMIYGASLSWNPEGSNDINDSDKAISVLEFGNQAENIMTILRELSRQQPFNWQHLIFWMERDVVEKDFIDPIVDGVGKLDHCKVSASYYKAIELERELTKLAGIIPEHRRLDMMEFIISAEGIALTQAAYLAIKKYYYGVKEVELLVNPQTLASRLDYWLVEYCRLWRERNKESELEKITKSLMNLTDFLRNI